MRELVLDDAGNPLATRRQAAAEVAFWIFLAVAYVVSSKLRVPIRYVMVTLGTSILLYGYVVWRRRREQLRHYGIRLDNLRAAAVATGIFTAVAAAVFAGVAIVRDVPLWRPEFLILWPTYPLYGFGQQLAVQSFHRRLFTLTESRLVCVVVVALVFGLLHTGRPLLWLLTTVAGIAWALLYQRFQNLLPLAVSHGFLASLAYAYLFDVNPLKNV